MEKQSYQVGFLISCERCNALSLADGEDTCSDTLYCAFCNVQTSFSFVSHALIALCPQCRSYEPHQECENCGFDFRQAEEIGVYRS